MSLEGRVRMLAAGSFGIAATTYYFLGVWLLAQVGKNHPIDLVAVILILTFWGSIYFTLRPLIPDDAPRNSN
jgi:hypothetical protein